MALPVPRDESTLKLLFFPTMADITDGNLAPKHLQLPTRCMEMQSELPAMERIHRLGNSTVQTRRPGFLEALDDNDYCHVYEYLLANPSLCIPTWESLHRSEKHTQKIVMALLSHITCWYMTNWSFPEQADSRRRTFQWPATFRDVVLVESPLEENGRRGYTDDADLLEISENVIQTIWEEVDQNPVWADKKVMAEVSLHELEKRSLFLTVMTDIG